MWLRYKPMVSVAYLLQSMAQFLIIYYLTQTSFQQKRLVSILVLAGVGLMVSLVVLHFKFMTAMRYKIVLRLLGYILGLGILSGLLAMLLQLFLTVEQVLVVSQMVTATVSTFIRYWLYRSLLLQEVTPIGEYPHWKVLVIVVVCNSVGILFLPMTVLFIVELIFWIVIIQLLFNQCKV